MEPKKKSIPEFIDFVYEFYTTMKSQQVILVYEGVITHEIVKAFSALAEANMERNQEDASIQKKVYFVMVESLQNISKHSDSAEEDKPGRGVFIISRADEHYMMTTGNIVENSKVDGLKKSLDQINSMNPDELKELYKTQMKGGSISEKGGAGLGFISIARKTESKLQYSFQPIDDKTTFFILSTNISRNNN